MRCRCLSIWILTIITRMSRDKFSEEQINRFHANKKRRAKKRFIIKLLKIIRMLFIIAVIIGLFVVFSYFFCKLESVSVEDSTIYTNEQIEAMVLNDEYSYNAMYVFLKNKIKPIKGIEFIDHFDVKLIKRKNIKIIVHQKPIVGYIIHESGYVYFDDDGIICDISQVLLPDIMKIDGLECENPEVNTQLDIGESEAMFLLALNKVMKKYNLEPEIIRYDGDGTVTLEFLTYSIDVGNSQFLDDKMSRLEYILPSIRGQYGVLHLDNYSMDNTDIVFEKMGSTDE